MRQLRRAGCRGERTGMAPPWGLKEPRPTPVQHPTSPTTHLQRVLAAAPPQLPQLTVSQRFFLYLGFFARPAPGPYRPLWCCPQSVRRPLCCAGQLN